MKKILSLILAVILIVSLVSCTEKQTGVVTDLSKPITLHWIMPGPGIQPDSAKVFEKFNEELHKIDGFENVNVEIEVIPVADYSQKFFLMATSGEPMDIVQTYTLDYATEFRNGTLLALDDYMQYMKDTKENVPEWVIEMGKVDGKQAIIPNYQKMVSAPYAIQIPKELAQYADVEGIQKAFFEGTYMTPEMYAPMEEYLQKVLDAGKIGKGVNFQRIGGSESVIRLFSVYYDDPEHKVQFVNFSEPAKYMYDYAQRWYEKGFVRKDILSANAQDSNGVINGNVLWTAQDWTGTAINTNTTSFDIETISIPMQNKFYVPFKPAAGGMSIAANSKYPDVAMKIINLMNSKKGIELYNLLVYGIEGEHYEVVKEYDNGDKMVKPLDYVNEGTSASKYGLWKWIVGNAKNAYLTTDLDDNYKEFIYGYMNEGKDTIPSELMGFAVVMDSIETKYQQVIATNSEYASSLEKGVFRGEEFDAKYKEYVDKMTAAGYQDIEQELQRQVDEFLKTK